MKTRSPRRLPSAAFTLIELLTVIAIIGVLAAIIIPVTGKVRATARNAQCVAKLRDWGRAIMLYANDNKGRYQCENWLSAASNPYLGYLPAIRDSGGALRVEAFSYCPVVSDSKYSDSTFTRRSTYAMIIPSVEGNIANYINTEPFKTRNTITVGGVKIVGAPLSRATQPSQYLMMCDSMGGSSTAFNANATAVPVDPMFGLAAPADDRGGTEVASRHGKRKINGLFGDGSVRSISGTPAGSGDKQSLYEMRNTWFLLY
jgi:prepilin-type N-terminal cleavage/methylation domain-containing protein/prepilin-type processing-associated H-X9-DG protein